MPSDQSSPPKYALPEIERRFLVELEHVGQFARCPARTIEDLYLSDSRLRLRKMTASGADPIYKLCKKYGKRGVSEWITNLYLSEREYETLAGLAGVRLRKMRYSLPTGVLDVFEEPRLAFAVFEVEFTDRQRAEDYVPPAFTARELTGDEAYTGAALAAGAAELR